MRGNPSRRGIRWEPCCTCSGLPAPEDVLVVKVLLLLTARSAPNKIEKQFIANGTFMLFNPVIYKEIASDWRHAGGA